MATKKFTTKEAAIKLQLEFILEMHPESPAASYAYRALAELIGVSKAEAYWKECATAAEER